MGVPLVATMFDFGRKGATPANGELLDFLAAALVSPTSNVQRPTSGSRDVGFGWSLKKLHRLIVTSAAYRMSSSQRGAEGSRGKDPDNRGLWRREPVRLEAEVVRDSLLALAGKLNATMGGPPVLAAQQAASRRRSLYFFHSDTDRSLFLTTFDGAAPRECYRREQSIIPQQALALTNGAMVLDYAGPIADRLSKRGDETLDDTAFIRRAFAVVLGIQASEAEVAASRRAMEAWRTQKPPLGERGQLVWVLLNHNDFVTLR